MTRISRRSFLKRTVALGAGAVLMIYSDGTFRMRVANAGAVAYSLRILHTNDHHAHIEPVGVTISTTPSSVTRNFGGVARRKTLIDQLRTEAQGAGTDLILLDAGDVFQGTLYFNQYSGRADLDFYRRIGYDAVAIGNHEFDKGDQTLADYITGATTGTYPGNPTPALGGTDFPVLSANITVDAGSPLAGLIQPNTVITTTSGQKIGIFGLTTEDTPVLSSPSANVHFTDHVAAATAQVAALQADPTVTKIICLSHIGYSVDLALAAAVPGIDVIVGGHSHSPLLPSGFTEPVGIAPVGEYPTVVVRGDSSQCVVVTDWEWGKWLGDITIDFDGNGGIAGYHGNTIHPVWADGLGTPPRALLPGEGAEITPDATLQGLIDNTYKPPIAALQATKIGETAVLLNGGSSFRTRESNLGDLIADAILERTRSAGAQITITNSGGIRAPINAGDITVGNVLEVLPFGNTIALVSITGANVIAALENGVSQVESNAGRFPQVAGLRFSWNRNAAPGSRVHNVEIWDETMQMYMPIDPNTTYRVATNNFMLTGGDGYSVFTPAGGGTNQVDTGLIMADEVQAYITAKSANAPLNVSTQGRILADSIWLPVVAVLAGPTPTQGSLLEVPVH
jgi:5'-nucleotidase